MHLAAARAGTPRGRPPSAPADDGTARGRRARSSPPPRPAPPRRLRVPSRSAARHSKRHVADRLGRRDEQQPPGLGGKRLEPPQEALLDPARQRHRRSGSPKPPASSAGVSPRGSSSSASGLPRVSATIRSRTRSSSRPRIAESEQRARVAVARARRPPARAARPARARRSARAPRTPAPTGSASSRRATNARVCADARSSHCASSTTQTSGCSSADLGQQAEHRQPDQEAIGRRARRSGRTPSPSASRCGPGRRSRRSSIGAHSWCRPAKASSISDSTPAARAMRHPDACSTR